MQVAIRAELHMLPPPQKQEVLQSALQQILSTLGKSLQGQMAEISVGGLLQIMLELQYLHAALTAYISSRLEAEFVKLGAELTQHLQDVIDKGQDGQAVQLDSWLGHTPGSNWPQQMQAGLAQVLKSSSQMQQMNLRALQT